MLKKSWVLIVVFMGILTAGQTFAENVTGWRKFDTNFLTLYLHEGANPYRIDRKIKVHGIKVYSNPTVYKPTDEVMPSLIGKIDLIYAKVSEILDMNPQNANITIKFVRSQNELTDEYKGIYGEEKILDIFYDLKLNTIFASEQTASEDTLAHAIAKAIMCNYFAVPPPEKIESVLLSYVDREFKK